MTARCPHCNGELAAPAAHRGELERQLGDERRAALFREVAASYAHMSGPVVILNSAYVAWRGYVWAKVRVRKPAVCCITEAPIPAGGWAWRQLSEVRDRDLRVAAATWEGVT